MANTKKAPITGTKTEAQKAAALKNAKGPKPGSARANQTAKLAPEPKGQVRRPLEVKTSKLVAKPDVIKEVKGTTDGRYVAVTAGGDNSLIYPATLAGKAELAKLAAVGASFKALQQWLKTHKPEAKLATGLDGRNAPQSAMAAAESRKAGKGDSGGRASASGGAVKGASKAAPTGSTKGDFTYSVGKANDTRPDTWTHYMVALIQKHTDTASAKAAHAKSGKYAGKKLDFAWSKTKGFIK